MAATRARRGATRDGRHARSRPPPAAAPATPGAKSIEQIYRAAAPGVVQVNQGDAEGSGFVLDRQGDVVTNAHVVTNGGPVTVSFSNDDRVPATVVGFDNSTDVALLKVTAPATALVPLPLGDSATLQVGDGVVAIGNPFGLDRSATSGIVSALNREITSPNGFGINGVIQTDAAINHGNSGGPLLNLQGQVVGINSQIADSGVDANVGVGFAIPIDTVKQITHDLAANGSISHAYLGVQLTPVDPTLASAGEAARLARRDDRRRRRRRPGRERRPPRRRPARPSSTAPPTASAATSSPPSTARR